MGNPVKNKVEVPEGAYAPIPNDQHMLAGPGVLEVTRYPDGKVTGLILSGSPITAKAAVKRKLRRIAWGI